MTPPRATLIDTHAHLDLEEFDQDRLQVIERAAEAGVAAIVAVAITADSSRAALRLADRHDLIHAAVGIHPNSCGEAAPGEWEEIRRLVERPGVVAVGETGLDTYRDFAPLELQRDYFHRHLRLAAWRRLPIIIHCRDAEQEILAMLREARSRGELSGILHSFTGSAEVAAECIELGLHIGFAGMVTFKKSDALRAVAATIAADRILVETDSPYLSPHPLRGKRNEPANVVHTARLLAEVRGVTFEEFAAQTTENARRLFGLSQANP